MQASFDMTWLFVAGGVLLFVVAILAICVAIVAYAAVKWSRSKK